MTDKYGWQAYNWALLVGRAFEAITGVLAGSLAVGMSWSEIGVMVAISLLIVGRNFFSEAVKDIEAHKSDNK